MIGMVEGSNTAITSTIVVGDYHFNSISMLGRDLCYNIMSKSKFSTVCQPTVWWTKLLTTLTSIYRVKLLIWVLFEGHLKHNVHRFALNLHRLKIMMVESCTLKYYLLMSCSF